MKDYIIITDSATDLPQNLIEEIGTVIIPFTYNIDGNEYFNYLDGHRDDPHWFYDQIRAGKTAVTSAINTGSYIEIFEPYLKSGRDVLYISLSSALSASYDNAISAVKELAPRIPNRKLLVIDSLSASLGEGLLVYLAVREKEKDGSIEQVYDFIMENRLKICHWFTVDDLNHLKRGGRLSATEALLGTMLGIKPILHVDDLGRLVPAGKIRGRRQSLKQFIEKMAERAENPGRQVVFISHGDCMEDARFVEAVIRERFKTKDIFINYISPAIGAHSGPGTVALFFVGSPR
jgi:DegV family protein with EDD domain